METVLADVLRRIQDRITEVYGWSQVDLANALGTYDSTVSDWFSNRRKMRLKDLVEIANVLNISLTELIGDERTDVLNRDEVAKVRAILDAASVSSPRSADVLALPPRSPAASPREAARHGKPSPTKGKSRGRRGGQSA